MSSNKVTFLVQKPYTPSLVHRADVLLQPYVDYDLDIEAAVLGICINEKHAFGTVVSVLNEDCFFDNAHLQLYRGLKTVFDEGYPIDGIILNSIIQRSGVVELKHYHEQTPISAAAFICRLSYGVLESAHLETWCILLRQLAAARIMKQLTTQGLKGGDIFDSAAAINEKLKKIMEVRTTDSWQHISKVAYSAMSRMEAKVKDETPGITTTFKALDDSNGGFRPGNLVVVAARPRVGKSALIGRFAIRQAYIGVKVGIISLEMNNEDIFDRMTSAEGDVSFSKIDRNNLEEGLERQRVYDAIGNLSALPIYFSDVAQVNVQDIRGKADKLMRKHGCDILYIDYLQLIEPDAKKNAIREQEVAKMSRDLKLLAKSLNIPVVLLAQLNRESESKASKDRKPHLHNLRESGAIEQDADVVIMLHRDWVTGVSTNVDGSSTEREADLLVRKWRNGAEMELKIGFEGDKMRFFDPDTEVKFLTQPMQTKQIDNPAAGIKGVYRNIPTSSQDTKQEEPPF